MSSVAQTSSTNEIVESGLRKRKTRRSRGRGLRVKTGCTDCRERHIKCDEARPRCRRCVKASRECRYNDTLADSHPRDETQSADGDGVGSTYNVASNVEDEPFVSSRDPGVTATNSFDHNTGETQSTPPEPLKSPIVIQDLDDSGFVPPPQGPQSRPAHVVESPGSTLSGSNAVFPPHIATFKWFSLLTGNEFIPDHPELPPRSESNIAERLDQDAQLLSPQPLERQQEASNSVLTPLSSLEIVSAPPYQQYDDQDRVELSVQETQFFRHFVDRLSGWLDITDLDRSFSINVSVIALQNKGLMNAVLALVSRHLLTIASGIPQILPIDHTVPVRYYNDTLHYLQSAMCHDTYLRSDELLATVLIISTYEMIDDNNSSWERHLKGVFWIQNSQLIHGESGGLKQAIWWAWLRQDIWAAFHERRRVMSYYICQKPCSTLSLQELLNRSVFLLARCVNFASDREVHAGQTDINQRMEIGTNLSDLLDEWWIYFGPYYHELPLCSTTNDIVRPVWIHPVSCCCAAQMALFARVLLLVHRPATGGLKDLQATTRRLRDVIDSIIGIGCAVDDDAAILVATQCLYGAGLYTEEDYKQQKILTLLQLYRTRIGWPSHDLGAELQRYWTAGSA